jgi:hypothetical protein
VQRSAVSGKAQNETTWAVLVIRVVLDDLTVRERLSQLLNADASQDAVINGVFRKLKITSFDLGPYLFDHDFITLSDVALLLL